ncbi:hypothetical protein HDV05_007274, partial [Chytridiales sp. JEL 0842]
DDALLALRIAAGEIPDPDEVPDPSTRSDRPRFISDMIPERTMRLAASDVLNSLSIDDRNRPLSRQEQMQQDLELARSLARARLEERERRSFEEDRDAEVARRLEQELQDEDMARRLAQGDQEEYSPPPLPPRPNQSNISSYLPSNYSSRPPLNPPPPFQPAAPSYYSTHSPQSTTQYSSYTPSSSAPSPIYIAPLASTSRNVFPPGTRILQPGQPIPAGYRVVAVANTETVPPIPTPGYETVGLYPPPVTPLQPKPSSSPTSSSMQPSLYFSDHKKTLTIEIAKDRSHMIVYEQERTLFYMAKPYLWTSTKKNLGEFEVAMQRESHYGPVVFLARQSFGGDGVQVFDPVDPGLVMTFKPMRNTSKPWYTFQSLEGRDYHWKKGTLHRTSDNSVIASLKKTSKARRWELEVYPEKVKVFEQVVVTALLILLIEEV